jgi:hypothetical protein
LILPCLQKNFLLRECKIFSKKTKKVLDKKTQKLYTGFHQNEIGRQVLPKRLVLFCFCNRKALKKSKKSCKNLLTKNTKMYIMSITLQNKGSDDI